MRNNEGAVEYFPNRTNIQTANMPSPIQDKRVDITVQLGKIAIWYIVAHRMSQELDKPLDAIGALKMVYSSGGRLDALNEGGVYKAKAATATQNEAPRQPIRCRIYQTCRERGAQSNENDEEDESEWGR